MYELDRDLRGIFFRGFTDIGDCVRCAIGVGADAYAAAGTLHGLRRFDLADRQLESASALRTLKRKELGVGFGH